MHSQQPILYVFAGNNGSGKSTLRNLIMDELLIDIHIDPDAIARRIDSKNPQNRSVSAGKEAIRSVQKYMEEEKSFSIETTLAGKNAVRQMQNAKKRGYEVTMLYLALCDVNLNIERVAVRVKNGGHHIPTADIIRRKETSFGHLYEYSHLVDNLVLIDNSADVGQVLLEVNNEVITFETENLPRWARPVQERYRSKLKTAFRF